MKGAKRLYLICSNDYLQTAFFCGTASECAEILGLRGASVFHSMRSKGMTFCEKFAHIEKVTEGIYG